MLSMWYVEMKLRDFLKESLVDLILQEDDHYSSSDAQRCALKALMNWDDKDNNLRNLWKLIKGVKDEK